VQRHNVLRRATGLAGLLAALGVAGSLAAAGVTHASRWTESTDLAAPTTTTTTTSGPAPTPPTPSAAGAEVWTTGAADNGSAWPRLTAWTADGAADATAAGAR
jgi:hypothetical protein